jgi:hypothetical protein
MPTPFPGMDPYLEESGLWPDVHHRLITVASDLLVEQLRPRYYVRIEDRVFISDEDDVGREVIIPDLRVVEPNPPWNTTPAGSGLVSGGNGATATIEPVEATTLLDEEIREPRIEIIDRDQRSVVTVIEIISPTNKVRGSRGRANYEEKRHEVMRSPSHWVEIDLLRGGSPITARELLPPHDYLVHVSRVSRRPRGLVWPIPLDRRLPVISVPLRGNDPDARLDLQAVLNTAYDRAAYDLQLDYRAEPRPPLRPEQADWAAALLRDKGLR